MVVSMNRARMSGVLPFDGGDDRVRAAGVRCGEGLGHGVVVAAVDGGGGPAVDREPGGDAAGPAVRGRGVVDHDDVQVVQADGAGVRDRLVVAALVEFGVAEQDPDARLGEALGAEAECGAVSGSTMSNTTTWSVLGPIIALVGVVIAVTGWRVLKR